MKVVAVEGEDHEGRQWGYEVVGERRFELRGLPILRAVTGGTGPCWNITLDAHTDDEETLHVCDLDEFIAALTVLRDSDANREHKERWA